MPAPRCCTSMCAKKTARAQSACRSSTSCWRGCAIAVPDMVLQVGGSISFAPETEGDKAKWLSDDTRHMLAELDPKPDQVTVTVNTSQMNVVEQMEPADIAGTSLAEPGRYKAYREMIVPGGPGWAEEHVQAADRGRHPERVPVLQHQQLRDGRAHDPARRLQGPAGDELGRHRRRHGRAEYLQPRQLRARHAGRRDADARELDAQRAADQHDGNRAWACMCAAASRTTSGRRTARARWARSSRSSSSCASRREVGREIATGKEARRICKIDVFYNSIEETLAKNGFAPNRVTASSAALRRRPREAAICALVLRSLGLKGQGVSKDGNKNAALLRAILRDARGQSPRAPQDEVRSSNTDGDQHVTRDPHS